MPPHDDSCICGCGIIPLRLQSGLYRTQSVQDLSEDCGLGLSPELLSCDRRVQIDLTNGEFEVAAADGTDVLGRGPIRCNEGKLIYSKSGLQRGDCIYDTARSSLLRVTADSTFTLKYTETQTQFRSAAGQTCTPPGGGSCRISFTLYLKQ
jgi:hypothetical protein